jgi:magnesium chelatase family protein
LLQLPHTVERAVAVATAGRHHLLLLGPRGSGKSQALEWRSTLEPPASRELLLRHQLIAELGQSLTEAEEGPVPIRRVSSQVRAAALVGNIANHLIRPGEFALANGGLLLADELPEWSRDSREALREPLERGRVALTRVQGSLELPASFVFAGTGNLCACGGWPPDIPVPGQFKSWITKKAAIRCQCRPAVRAAYLSRLSGPILDRIDFVLLALPVPPEDGDQSAVRERVARLRERIEAARERLRARWGSHPGAMAANEVQALLEAHPAWKKILDDGRSPTLRSRHKIARIALSLAAWDGLEEPTEGTFAEAALYRAENLGLEDARRLE